MRFALIALITLIALIALITVITVNVFDFVIRAASNQLEPLRVASNVVVVLVVIAILKSRRDAVAP
jgi:hypothetical protein